MTSLVESPSRDGQRRPTGVCVIRTEQQSSERVLISISWASDIEHGGIRTSRSTDPDEALRIVEGFLGLRPP